MMMYDNRVEAGNLLYKELQEYKDHKDAVIVTIPRGAVPLGFTLADKLNLPLDIVLSKKIGHPFNKEYAIGAATLEGKVLSNAASEVSNDYIEKETKYIREILKARFKLYYGSNKPINLTNKIVILVDDGVATGNTLVSCVKLLQQQEPAKIIVALPVASKSALKRIQELVTIENTICLYAPVNFHAVGQFYTSFDQVDDQEVVELLNKANNKFKIKQFNS